MAKPYRPAWLPWLLAAAVVLPVVVAAGLLVRSVHADEAWAAPGKGFAWLRVFVFAPAAVLVAALACRAAARRDAEVYQAIGIVFAVAAEVFSIGLAGFAAVALGVQEGRLRPDGLAFALGGWTYTVVMALGHWHLYLAFHPAGADSPERPLQPIPPAR